MEDLSLEEREAAEGAPPRLRGLSLEEKARVAESGGESWEKSGEWSGGGLTTADFGDSGPPVRPRNVRQWLGERMADPMDPCVSEGDACGARGLAAGGPRPVQPPPFEGGGRRVGGRCA